MGKAWNKSCNIGDDPYNKYQWRVSPRNGDSNMGHLENLQNEMKEKEKEIRKAHRNSGKRKERNEQIKTAKSEIREKYTKKREKKSLKHRVKKAPRG